MSQLKKKGDPAVKGQGGVKTKDTENPCLRTAEKGSGKRIGRVDEKEAT